MEYVIVASAYILVLIFDFSPLIRKRQKKEAAVYGALVIISLGILIARNLTDFPSITELITRAVGSVIDIGQ